MQFFFRFLKVDTSYLEFYSEEKKKSVGHGEVEKCSIYLTPPMHQSLITKALTSNLIDKAETGNDSC